MENNNKKRILYNRIVSENFYILISFCKNISGKIVRSHRTLLDDVMFARRASVYSPRDARHGGVLAADHEVFHSQITDLTSWKQTTCFSSTVSVLAGGHNLLDVKHKADWLILASGARPSED